MIKPIKKHTGLKWENAQTMVEFALVFPIVLLITYGIIEFGRMVFIYASVTGAAREGARYGAASGSLTTPYFTDCTGIHTATQKGAILIPIPVGNISIWYDKGPGTSHIIDSCPPLLASIKLGYRIGVHVVAHYAPIIPFLGLSGFDINSENARTILVNMQMVTPSP
jgi:TadE-like protein